MSDNEVEIKVVFHREPTPDAAVKADAKKLGDEAGKALTDGMSEAVDAEAPKLEDALGKAGTKGGKKARKGIAAELGKDGEKIGEKLGEDLVDGIAQGVDRAAPKLDEPMRRAGKRGGGEAGKHAGDEFLKSLPFGIGKGAFAIGEAIVKSIDKIAPQVAQDAVELGEKAGKAVAGGVVSGVGAAAQDIPQLFTPEGAIGAAIVGSAIATLAPLAASAIGAALALGVGAAVIGVGVVIEHNTPRVVGALEAFKTRTADVMKDAATPIVEPIVGALGQLDAWIHNEAQDFGDIFTTAAPGVKGLTGDIIEMVTSIMPGLGDITEMFSEFTADPETEAAFERLGKAISDLFGTIADNKEVVTDTFGALVLMADVAITVFNALLVVGQAFDSVVRGIGGAVTWLFDKIGLGGGDANATLISMHDNTNDLVAPTENAAKSYDDLAGSLSAVSNTADTLAGVLADKVFGTLVRGDLATLHFDESLTRIGKSFADNGKSLKIMTEAGQANREAILTSVQANIEQYDSMVAAGLSAKDAAAAYDTNTAALEKQLHSAGLLPAQIQAIIGKYKDVPDKVNTTVAILGLEKAIEDLNATLRLINGIHDKTVTINVRRVGGVAGTGPYTASAHASGGVAGGWTTLNERGPELVKLPQGSMVYPAGQSQQMMAAQQGGGGQQLRVEIAFTGNTDTAMAGAIQNMVRTGKIQLKANGQTVKVG